MYIKFENLMSHNDTVLNNQALKFTVRKCVKHAFTSVHRQSQCLYINPIALRMAKTPKSFGHSGCNRVK